MNVAKELAVPGVDRPVTTADQPVSPGTAARPGGVAPSLSRSLSLTAWYACAEPERPTDAAVLWHYEGCLACVVKSEALEWQYPDDPHVQWLRQTIGGADEVGGW